MTSFEFNDDAINEIMEQIGEQIRTIVNNTVQETADLDIATATDTLHERLNAVDGLSFDREWAQHAVETLRRGDDLNIELG